MHANQQLNIYYKLDITVESGLMTFTVNCLYEEHNENY